jgi:hypothetical protein
MIVPPDDADAFKEAQSKRAVALSQSMLDGRNCI